MAVGNWFRVLLLPLTVPAGALAQGPADYRPMSITLEDVPYPYPVSYLPLVMYGQDVRLAYMDVAPAGAPNGKTVALLHGLNFFGEYWTGTIDALRNEGYRVVVPDQVGFGRSSKPIMPYTLHDMAANTRKLLQSLGIAEAAVVGHSMGGMLATRFAFSYPDVVTRLALVNMIGLEDFRLARPWRDIAEVYQASLKRSYEEIKSGMERYFVTWKPEYDKYVRIHYGWTQSGDWPRLAMVRALLQQMIYVEPVVYEWPHLKPKTLVIGGDRDGPNFPELAQRVAAAVPNAELALIPGVGHNPHLEAPAEFRARLIRFLR
ncbi:MAG: alpha/beta hydrolase [Gemmatimonadota bacterium]